MRLAPLPAVCTVSPGTPPNLSGPLFSLRRRAVGDQEPGKWPCWLFQRANGWLCGHLYFWPGGTEDRQWLPSLQTSIQAVWVCDCCRARLWGRSPKIESLSSWGGESRQLHLWAGRRVEARVVGSVGGVEATGAHCCWKGCQSAACPGNTCFLLRPVDTASSPVPCERGTVGETRRSSRLP